jgi:MtN3 and saliva related transmembrane protein
MRELIAVVFGLGLIINALLFIPQGVAIWRSRSAQGVSILTFCGFCVMQAIGVLHGYFERDWSLMVGMAISLIACGGVTALAIAFRIPVKARQTTF